MKVTFSIKTSKELLDKAFRRAKEITSKSKSFDDQKEKAINKISTVENVISYELGEIVNNLPKIDRMPLFYQDLFDTYLDRGKYKKCLYHVSWTKKKISEMSRVFINKIKGHQKKDLVVKDLKSFYGRVSSLIEDLEVCLNYLRESVGVMRKFPEIDFSKVVFVVAGYPNVGKSSLIKALTNADVSSQPYPFTTKDLLVGKGSSFLLIDTPGIMERNFEKLNNIEKKGFLALKHLSKHVLFVFDPTLSSGYDLNDQRELYRNIKKYFVPDEVVVVVNKIDLLNERPELSIEDEGDKVFYVSSHTREGIEKLKEYLESKAFKILSSSLKTYKQR